MTRAESVVEGTPSRGMAAGQSYPSLEALLKLEASLKNQLCGHEASPQDGEVARVCASSPISSTSCLGKGRMRPRTWGPRLRAWYPRLQARRCRRHARRRGLARAGRALVAPVQRSDRARYRHAMADRGDQGKFRARPRG